MNSLDEALARLKAAEAERDAACREAWEVVKAEYPAVVNAFDNLYVSDDDAAARWLGGQLTGLGMTGFELIAAGQADDVVRRLGQIAAGVYI